MSEWDDLAEMVEWPAKTKPAHGSLRTSIKNATHIDRGGLKARGAPRHKRVVSIATVNLPDLPAE